MVKLISSATSIADKVIA